MLPEIIPHVAWGIEYSQRLHLGVSSEATILDMNCTLPPADCMLDLLACNGVHELG